jgi:hypothetical protein
MSDRICSTFEAGYWSRTRLTCEATCQAVVVRAGGEYMISFSVPSPRSIPSGGVPARLANVGEK